MNPAIALMLVLVGAVLLVSVALSAIIIWWQKVDPREDGRWPPRQRNDSRGFEVLPSDEAKDEVK